MKEAFSLFDRLGGGIIRSKDLGFVMRSIGYQTSSAELERMIREADQDGKISSTCLVVKQTTVKQTIILPCFI